MTILQLATTAAAAPLIVSWAPREGGVFSFGLLTALMIWRKDPVWSFRLFEAFAIVEGYWIGLACVGQAGIVIAAAGIATMGIFMFLSAISLFLTSLGIDFGFLVPLLAEALTLLVFSLLA